MMNWMFASHSLLGTSPTQSESADGGFQKKKKNQQMASYLCVLGTPKPKETMKHA
jgi:hypothetical protein